MKRLLPAASCLAVACLVSTPALSARQDRGVRVDPAASGRRVALVIGNSSYARGPLSNPVNDATDMATTLHALKFDDVQLAINTTKVELQRSVNQFVASVKTGDAALFYYSGHGIQIGGENYLLPVDYTAQNEAEARFEGLPATLIHEKLTERGARLKILIFDACRNNPFSSSRSADGGLAPMGGKGSFIAFATGPNSIADDNQGGRNGLFTTYLLEAIQRPGLTLDQVLSRVRVNVDSASNGRQTPWTNSSVIGDFYFIPTAGGAADLNAPLTVPRVEAPAQPVDPKTAVGRALAAYRAAYENMDVEGLRAVYPKFPDFQALQKRFDDFQGIALAMATPQITIHPDNTASATSVYSMTFTTRAGKTESTKPQRADFSLRLIGSAWVIESINYR